MNWWLKRYQNDIKQISSPFFLRKTIFLYQKENQILNRFHEIRVSVVCDRQLQGFWFTNDSIKAKPYPGPKWLGHDMAQVCSQKYTTMLMLILWGKKIICLSPLPTINLDHTSLALVSRFLFLKKLQAFNFSRPFSWVSINTKRQINYAQRQFKIRKHHRQYLITQNIHA